MANMASLGLPCELPKDEINNYNRIEKLVYSLLAFFSLSAEDFDFDFFCLALSAGV